jgi:hypothetical protein
VGISAIFTSRSWLGAKPSGRLVSTGIGLELDNGLPILWPSERSNGALIITPYFVFLHVPKTGGSWLKSTIPDDWRLATLRNHEPRRNIPGEYARLPVLAFVRNPWDWYVSHYAYHVAREPRDARIELLFANGSSFESFLRTALYGANFPVTGKIMQSEKIDFYTVVLRNLTGPEEGIWFGRFENLREDFQRFLETIAAPVTDELRDKIRSAPPENASDRRPYRDYYTDELRDLVAERSRLIIDRFGYSF